MPESNDRHGQTSTEDEAFIAAARRLVETLKGHPFVLGFLAILGAAAIFLLGVRIGEIVYLAFDGEGMMAAVFGATFVTVLVAIIGIGVILDRRQRARDAATGPLTDQQRDRLRAYVQPASPLVRWYQPAAVTVFIARRPRSPAPRHPVGQPVGPRRAHRQPARPLAPLPGTRAHHP